MKAQTNGVTVLAEYDRVRCKWALRNQAAMENAGIAPLGPFSKFFDMKEDAWEPVHCAAAPGKFIGLNKNIFSRTNYS